MKTKQYVAPCVQQKPRESVTGCFIASGLVITSTGAGITEGPSILVGILVATVGLTLMYIGVRRARSCVRYYS